jgi:hypothetical protein
MKPQNNDIMIQEIDGQNSNDYEKRCQEKLAKELESYGEKRKRKSSLEYMWFKTHTDSSRYGNPVKSFEVDLPRMSLWEDDFENVTEFTKKQYCYRFFEFNDEDFKMADKHSKESIINVAVDKIFMPKIGMIQDEKNKGNFKQIFTKILNCYWCLDKTKRFLYQENDNNDIEKLNHEIVREQQEKIGNLKKAQTEHKKINKIMAINNDAKSYLCDVSDNSITFSVQRELDLTRDQIVQLKSSLNRLDDEIDSQKNKYFGLGKRIDGLQSNIRVTLSGLGLDLKPVRDITAMEIELCQLEDHIRREELNYQKKEQQFQEENEYLTTIQENLDGVRKLLGNTYGLKNCRSKNLGSILQEIGNYISAEIDKEMNQPVYSQWIELRDEYINLREDYRNFADDEKLCQMSNREKAAHNYTIGFGFEIDSDRYI